MLIFLFFFALLTSARSDSETLPWGVDRIHAGCVWDNNRDMTIDTGANAGQGVKVAVIDSGVYYWEDASGKHYHRDLQGNIVEGMGFEYYEGYVFEVSDYADEPISHGTHVTGTIAAVDNSEGIIGVAPRTLIYAAKCYSVYAMPTNEDAIVQEIVAGIYWAISKNVSVISISLGVPHHSDLLVDACWNAYYNHGILIIAAAGNDDTYLDFPAAYDFVVAVGAVYPDGSRWPRSNHGDGLDFMAPGVSIYSTVSRSGIDFYENKTGTSMAVPHVTAAAALVLASMIDPWCDVDGDGVWDPDEVMFELWSWAFDLGTTGWDYLTGDGLINPWGSCQRPDGDVTNDFKVDIKDLAIVSGAYGSYPGHPKWDARADVDVSNKVDITDLQIVSGNFGKHYP